MINFPSHHHPSDVLIGLLDILPKDAVIVPDGGITTYEQDGLASTAGEPLAVVLPETTAQVSELMRFARAMEIPVMPRGAGTSRCGGAVPLSRCLVVGTSRMRKVVTFDPVRGLIRVQPGVTNLAISDHASPAGWFYAPDPSSRRTCTIGGNIATNSSGACALRHGATVNHVVGLTVVMHDGEVLLLGTHAPGTSSADLMAFMCGSEGQLGFVTEASLRLEPVAERSHSVLATFSSEQDALACASELLHRGFNLFRLEFMDSHAVALMEAYAATGYDTDAHGTLLMELQGLDAEVEAELHALRETLKNQRVLTMQDGATHDENRDLWRGRTDIYRAASRTGAFDCLDGSVPLTRLPAALDQVRSLAAKHGLKHATVANAGDGTLHAFVLFDPQDDDSRLRSQTCSNDIRRACVRLGGSISAEYGVGLGRQELLGAQYEMVDLEQQLHTRAAFAPGDWLNPGKVFPRRMSAGALQ